MNNKTIVATLVIAIFACGIAGAGYYAANRPQRNTGEKSSTIPSSTAGSNANELAVTIQKADSVDIMAERLRGRLEKEPNDVDGWVLLARSYHYLQRWEEAKSAFEKARELGYRGDAGYSNHDSGGTDSTTETNESDAANTGVSFVPSAGGDEVFGDIARLADKTPTVREESAR